MEEFQSWASRAELHYQTALLTDPLNVMALYRYALFLEEVQYVAVRCCVLQCVAVCCRSTQRHGAVQCVAVCCSVLQCAAVFCSVLQCVAVCCRSAQRHCAVLQCAAVCCSVLQCATVCRSVLQCVAVCGHMLQFRFTSWHCTATPSFSRTYSCTCLFFVYRDLFLISEVMSISLRPTHVLYRYALSLMETGRCLSLFRVYRFFPSPKS